MGDVFHGVETPAGVIDVQRVTRNAEKVADYCARHGLAWRPHIKTHKSTRVAEIQLKAGARGLTVATPREAEVMSAITSDILLAYPALGESKLGRLMSLPPETSLAVALDSSDALEALAGAAAVAGRTVDVLIEIDVGLKRVGLTNDEELVLQARRARSLAGIRYRGILFYPGHIRTQQARQGELLDQLSRRVRGSIDALASVGLAPEVVSGGSTPTLWNSHRVDGLTEMRAGSCIFNDRESVSHGSATWDDLAYTVLATVVSTAVPGQAVVDAGSKALSKEIRSDDGSFGALLDRPEVVVSALSEEHGVLDLSRTTWKPRVGERVRVVPNHVCVSVNLQDRLLAVDGSSLEVWDIEARGRSAYRAFARTAALTPRNASISRGPRAVD